MHRYAPQRKSWPPATELRGSFKKNPKRKLDRAVEPQPSERLGAPPTRLKAPEKAAWNEMRESGFWLTTADQFMVEIAAGLLAKHRSAARSIIRLAPYSSAPFLSWALDQPSAIS